MDLFQIFGLNVIFLGIGVYIVTLTLKRVFADKLNASRLLKRLFPLLPIVFGVGIAFFPGVFPSQSIGIKVVNGLVASFLASYLHSLVKKTALGDVNLTPLSNGDKPVDPSSLPPPQP